MINTIGFNESERALKIGLLYSPADALKVNLVDEVVPETEVLDAARRAVTQYLSVPGELLMVLRYSMYGTQYQSVPGELLDI